MKTRTINETEETRRGELIVQILMLEPSRRESGRYETEWGTKTPLGLYRTIKRIIEKGE
jgi:hypothetical protein